MKKSNLFIPTIITLFLIVSSFIPVIQIILLTFNGGIVYVFGNITSTQNKEMAIILNIIISILCLIWFYKGKRKRLVIIQLILSSFFLFPIFYLLLENLTIRDNYYFLPMMIAGLLTGLVLLIVGYFKK